MAKRLVVVLGGVVAMSLAMVGTIYFTSPKGAAEVGKSLVFEMMDAKGDPAAELVAVRKRLERLEGVTAKGAASTTIRAC